MNSSENNHADSKENQINIDLSLLDDHPVNDLPSVSGGSQGAASSSTDVLGRIKDLEARRSSMSDPVYRQAKARIQATAPQDDPGNDGTRTQSHNQPTTVSAICKAQQIVGVAMAACVSMWFAPFVGGIACNMAEKRMVRELLSVLGGDNSDDAASSLFWFVRKKLFALNVATYVPYAGTGFQLLEVYALGQFTICCVTRYSGITDREHLSASWEAIEQQIFSGERVISAYEESTGSRFPEAIKVKFIPVVDIMRDTYRLAERVPGVMLGQEIAGEAMHLTAKTATKIWNGLRKKAMGAGR